MATATTPTKLDLVKDIIRQGNFYDRKKFFPKYLYLYERSDIPDQEYNGRGIWAEAELFVQEKLGCGEHPQIIEYAVLKELQSCRELYTSDFLNASFKIMQNLELAGAFKGVSSFFRYAEFSSNVEKRCEFQLDMAELFSNGDLMRKEGRDVDNDRYLTIFPPLNRKLSRTLAKMREAVEEAIKVCSQESKAVIAEITEDKARDRLSSLSASPEIIKRIALENPFEPVAPQNSITDTQVVSRSRRSNSPKEGAERKPLIEGRLRARMPPDDYDPHRCSPPPRSSRKRQSEHEEIATTENPVGNDTRRPDFHMKAIGRLVYKYKGSHKFIISPPKMVHLVPVEANSEAATQELQKDSSRIRNLSSPNRLRLSSSSEDVFLDAVQHIELS